MTRQQKLTAYNTIVIKEIMRFARIWLQTILPPAITTGLYFIIFGGLIGPRIGEMGGVTYMEFIIPGLIMMAIITNAYANVVSSFYMAKYSHSIEEMLVSPLPNSIILLGYITGGVARGLAVGLVVTLVSLLFSELHIHSFTVAISITIMTSILFSLAGFINAVFAESFDDISIIPTFVLTPLTYLGGVFYSVTMLPDFWQGVSLLNPILYMVNAFRYALLGVTDIPLYVSYLTILGFIIVLFFASLWLLNTGKGTRS
ncbi:MAG TPA: ABC transporter permease [Gammaproteobacteria bacterium]|nr:ABC transporter permease [Gammaproteobacteria bacterium]